MKFFAYKFMIWTGVVAALLLTGIQSASAAVTQKDFQTIIRTIGFLQSAPASNSVFAIMYDPDNGDSIRDARQMQGFIEKEGKKLQPRLVSVSDTGSLQGARYVFMTDGLQQHYKKIEPSISQYKILSFGLDRSCIDQGCCAVYINSGNRVEIIVNNTLADKVDARFKPVFLMMVTML
jgi:hypothetical protein